MSLVKLFNILIKNNKRAVIGSFVISIVTIMSSVCLMGLSSYIISFCALHPSIADISIAVVGVRFFGIGRGISRYFERLTTHNTTFSILSKLRVWLFEKIEHLPISTFISMDKGEVFTRIVDDIETLQEFFLRTFMPFVVAILVGIVGFVGLCFFGLTPALGFIGLYSIAVLILPVFIWYFTKGSYKKLLKEKSELKTNLIDFVGGLDELIGNSSIMNARDKLEEKLENNDETSSKLALWRSVADSMIMLLTNIAMVSCAGVGIILVHLGKLNGVYLTVLTLTASALFEATMGIPVMLQKLEQSSSAANRIFEIEKLSEETEIAEKVKINNQEEVHFIEAKNISFGYDERELVKDINLKLERGKHIALLGQSGSGKTTLSYLLMNWLKPSSGSIEVNGKSISKEYNLDMMEVFSVVDQNIYFFNTTIKNNLMLASSEVGILEIEEVLKKANIKEFIDTLPMGLDTELGENGMKLSGGQRQRLAVARALLTKKSFMLFDEPTAGLDVNNERIVFDTIHNCTEAMGILVITHRLVSMDKYDEILVLNKGVIEERGTHKELMENGKLYKMMWNLQREQLST